MLCVRSNNPRLNSQRKYCWRAKLYPSLGFKLSGTVDATLQTRIDAFFRYYVEYSMPVFVHCTPVGFLTRRHEGGNAHPKYWEPVLARYPDLRLCFGHTGGGGIDKHGTDVFDHS